MDVDNGLGSVIKALRKSCRMTQDEVAARTGLSRTSVTNIEAGRQGLTVASINALAAAMGYEVRVRFVKAKPVQPEDNFS